MMDKQQIVDLARDIGTEEFSAAIPEYCGVISVKPTTRARMEKIEREESRFDFQVLENAVADMDVVPMDRITLKKESDREASYTITSTPEERAVVVDIRHPDEEERNPLVLASNVIERIPFYRLNSVLSERNHSKTYLLYCDKGIMSRLHAQYLTEQGLENIGVYRPD